MLLLGGSVWTPLFLSELLFLSAFVDGFGENSPVSTPVLVEGV